MRLFCRALLLISSLFFTRILYDVLTLEKIMPLDEVAAEERTAQVTAEQGKGIGEDSKELGTEEIERPDSGKDHIYYSITTPEEEKKNEEEEREKLGTSLEILRNIIIDLRKR